MLLSRVAATIRRYCMFLPGDHVGVAVSGGADSVCLLHVLRELAPQWELRLSILHLNHGLRGEESAADERFVRDLAASLGLDVVVRAEDVAAAAGNLEQAGRAARLRLFHEQLAGGTIVRIAVGHTRNDQAETVLFRFLRGSGSAGLAGIRPVTGDGMVRPLLDVDRAGVEQYLRERGIAWRDDSSNSSPRFARNRIRHQLLPALAAEWNPAIAEMLVRTADWAQAEEEYWDAEIGRLAAAHLVERDGAILVLAGSLADLPLAAARRLVRHILERIKGDLRAVTFDHVAEILALASSSSGHGQLQLPGVEVARSFEWVRLVRAAEAPRDYSVTPPVPGVVKLPGTDIRISLELIEKAETLAPTDCVYNREAGFIDWRSLSGPLQIRNWRPGDRYHPNGRGGEEKIKILFQEARIPRWERSRWPVLTDGSAIVWARQFGPAQRFAAKSESAVLLKIVELEAP
jgi:tRNA(Ile)-lysidine synthase